MHGRVTDPPLPVAWGSAQGSDLSIPGGSMVDATKRRRKTIRLQGFDYSQPGAYFVTIVTQRRLCMFGEVIDGEMCLSRIGEIVAGVWTGLADHYPHVHLDAWVIMPNHLHGILVLDDVDRGSVRHGLSEVVRGFKSFSAKEVNRVRGVVGQALWQRSFFEHVIRDEAGLERIRRYIEENPVRWEEDPENPARRAPRRK